MSENLTKAQELQQYRIQNAENQIKHILLALIDDTRDKIRYPKKYLEIRYHQEMKELDKYRNANPDYLLDYEMAKLDKGYIESIVSRLNLCVQFPHNISSQEYFIDCDRKNLAMPMEEKADICIYEAKKEARESLTNLRVSKLAKAYGLPFDTYMTYSTNAVEYIADLSDDDFARLESQTSIARYESNLRKSDLIFRKDTVVANICADSKLDYLSKEAKIQPFMPETENEISSN